MKETYNLVSQIKRAAVSVPTNIIEGYLKEFLRECKMKEMIEIIYWLFPGFLTIFILTFLIRDIDLKKDLLGALVYSFMAYGMLEICRSNFHLFRSQSSIFIFDILVSFALAFLTIGFLGIGKVREWIIKTRSDIFMTAWDVAWRRMSYESPVFCEIHLKNGNRPVVGIFSSESSASFSYRKDGVYLEKTLSFDDNDNKLQIDESSLGVFIPHDEIKYIKFYKLEEEG